MATTVLNIIPRKEAEATQSAQYTAVGVKLIIDKFTATNTSSLNEQFSCNLVASGDTPGDDNLVLKEVTIRPGDTYMCPELVGQSLEAEGYISTLASTAGAITISATGREIS